MGKNPPLLFKAVGQAGAYTASPAVYKPTSSSSPSVRSVVIAKISKHPFIFFKEIESGLKPFLACSPTKCHHHGYGPGWSRRQHRARLRAGIIPCPWLGRQCHFWLGSGRNYFFEKIEMWLWKSKRSLDIRALAVQGPPPRCSTMACAHRRLYTRPEKPFLGLKDM